MIKMTVINPCRDICLQEYGVQPDTQLEMHHSTQVLLCHNHHHPDRNSPTSHHKPATHIDINKNLPHQSPYSLIQTGTRRTALPKTPFSLSYMHFPSKSTSYSQAPSLMVPHISVYPPSFPQIASQAILQLHDYRLTQYSGIQAHPPTTTQLSTSIFLLP